MHPAIAAIVTLFIDTQQDFDERERKCVFLNNHIFIESKTPRKADSFSNHSKCLCAINKVPLNKMNSITIFINHEM